MLPRIHPPQSRWCSFLMIRFLTNCYPSRRDRQEQMFPATVLILCRHLRAQKNPN